MVRSLVVMAMVALAMLYPHLPGRFDASAEAASFVIQVANWASLLLVPVGVAWALNRGRARQWRQVATVLGALVVGIGAMAAAAVNQLTLGLIIAACGAIFIRAAIRRSRSAAEPAGARDPLPYALVAVPVLLVAFALVVIPWAADRSRSRAIRHAGPLIAEIEAYRQRHGRYPVSMLSLNADVPTGVVGLERFAYEPNGEAYNLFFVRQAVALDAREVVMFNPRDQHRFASHELDILQYDGEHLERRRGDRRRTPLREPHWISILFD